MAHGRCSVSGGFGYQHRAFISESPTTCDVTLLLLTWHKKRPKIHVEQTLFRSTESGSGPLNLFTNFFEMPGKGLSSSTLSSTLSILLLFIFIGTRPPSTVLLLCRNNWSPYIVFLGGGKGDGMVGARLLGWYRLAPHEQSNLGWEAPYDTAFGTSLPLGLM